MSAARLVREASMEKASAPRKMEADLGEKAKFTHKQPPTSGLGGAKLKQAVMMAYDMFIGMDGVEDGPVPLGQVVMLVRMLPHLATAITLHETNDELCNHALRVINRLSISKEGISELLAHPCCQDTIVPHAMLFASSKNMDLLVPSKNIIKNVSADAIGRALLLESPKAPPNCYPADVVLDLLHTLAVDLLSPSPSITLEAITTLYSLTDTHVFVDWVVASPVATFEILMLGLIKRVSEKGIQVAERATAIFLKLNANEDIQFRLQEPAHASALRADFLTLVLIMNFARTSIEKQPSAEKAVNVLCKWTFRPSGLAAFWNSKVNMAQVVSGCSHLVDELLKQQSDCSDRLPMIGSVAGVLDNLVGNTEYCKWLAVRPDVLGVIMKLCLQMVRYEDPSCSEEVQGAGIEVIRSHTDVKVIRECMLESIRPHPESLLACLGYLISSCSRYKGVLEESLQTFFTLVNCEAWEFTTTAWLAKDLARPTGKSLLTALLQYTVYDDEVVCKFALDIVTTIVLKGGLDVFTDLDSKLILLDGLKRLLSEAKDKQMSEYASILVTVVMGWPNCVDVVCKALVCDEQNEMGAFSIAVGQLDRTMIGLALVLSDINQTGVDCALVILHNVLTYHLDSFAKVEPEVLHSVISALYNGPLMQDTKTRIFMLKLLHLITKNDRLVEGLVSWIVGEDDRTRADFIVYLCNLLEGDKECQYEVTKKAVSMLHLFVELIGEPLIEYPSVLECVFSALFASLESNSPRRQLLEELFINLVGYSLTAQMAPKVFGGVYLLLFQIMLMSRDEENRKSALDILEKLVLCDYWKQALVQWIASCAETHTSQLLFLFARWFVRKEADPVGVNALAVVTALVKLHSTKTGMAALVHQDASKYHEKILGGYLCMLRGTTEMRSIAIESLRRFVHGVPIEVLDRRLVLLLFQSITAVQYDHDKLQNLTIETFNFCGESQNLTIETINFCGDLVVNFLSRMDLLVIHAEVVELSAMCLSWVLQNCSKDTYKAAVETLVGFFAIERSSTVATHTALPLTVGAHAGEGGGVHNPEEVATDVFSLPEPVLHILLNDLHTLCKRQEEEYRKAGMITVMSLGTHTRFLSLQLQHLYPFIALIRDQMDADEVSTRAIATELMMSLATQEQISSLPHEVVSLLLNALSRGVASEDESLAEYAAKTFKQVSEGLNGRQNVPNEVLADLATRLHSADTAESMAGMEGIVRLCKEMAVSTLDHHVMEKCVFGLTEHITAGEGKPRKAELSILATKALGVFANATSGSHCSSSAAILQVVLQVLFRSVLSDTDAGIGSVAAVAVHNLCAAPNWKGPLKKHLQSPQMDHCRMVATMTVQMESADRTVAEAAHGVLAFAIAMLLPPNASRALFEIGTMTLLEEELHPTQHTEVAKMYLNLLVEWIKAEGVERVLELPEETVDDLLGSLIATLLSECDDMQSVARSIITDMMGVQPVAKLLLKALGGPAGDRLPDSFPVVLQMYLARYRTECFLVLNPNLLAKLGLVLMEYLMSDNPLKGVIVRKLMTKLMSTGAGAAYCMEVLIGGGQVMTSDIAIELLASYMEQQGCADIIFDPDMFLRVIRTLGRASIAGPLQAALAQRCVQMLRREGALGGFNLACVQHLITQEDSVLAGVSGQILEAWLAEDDKIRKANKLPVESVERLKKDMLHWAQAAQGKDMHIRNISRVVTSLTVCREVMTRCIPHWLVSTEPCVASIGLKGLYGWTKQHSMDVLLEHYPDLMLDAIKSITHYCQDTDYMLLACKFLRLTLESEKGISFLMRLPDHTLEHFVAKVASLLVVEEYSLGHQVTKIFTGHWNPFVQKVVGWYEYACQGDLEEERSSSSTASSVSGWASWFGGATPAPTKATEPRLDVFAPGSGYVVSKKKAHTILIDLLAAGRMRLHSADPSVSLSALELVGRVCSLNPDWVMTLAAMEGFSLDISKLVDFLSHSQDASEVLHAERIIFQLTSTAQGRTQLARHLHEDKAVMLLRALDQKTHGADEISELANQAFFNLTMEGDSTWQFWLSQLDPAFLKMQMKLQIEKDKMSGQLKDMSKDLLEHKRHELARVLRSQTGNGENERRMDLQMQGGSSDARFKG